METLSERSVTLTRRHVLAGAAATVAAAALPAVAVAEVAVNAQFDVERFITFAVAETERLHPGINAPARVVQFQSSRRRRCSGSRSDSVGTLLVQAPKRRKPASSRLSKHLMDI